MINAAFIVKIKNGKFDFGSIYNESRFRMFVRQLEGKELRIQKLVRKRSLNQNALYWFYLDLIERETGNNATDLHEYFKRRFLPPKVIVVLKKRIEIPSSTTDLNKIQFGEYLEKISAETGIPIPDTEAYKRWIDSAPMEGEVFEAKK